MQPGELTYQIYNYMDIFYEYFFNGEDGAICLWPEYTLRYELSGELVFTGRNGETTLRKGAYMFLRKNTDRLVKSRE